MNLTDWRERSNFPHPTDVKTRARIIQSVQDDHGNKQRTTKGIMRAFTTFLRRKYEPIAVDGALHL